MAVQNHYKIVCSVIRIASSTDAPPIARLKLLAQFIAETFHSPAVTFYLVEGEESFLSRKISSLFSELSYACRIPVGKGLAGKCAFLKAPIHRKRVALHPEETLSGKEREIIAFPVMDGQQLTGVMTIGISRETLADETETELFQCILLEVARVVRCFRQAEDAEKKLKELLFLYRISNTMLSTMKLNKLIHLILSAITSGSAPLFDRAMLFLANEKTHVLQGMMGIVRQSEGSSCQKENIDNAVSSWELTDAEIARHLESEFNCKVKEARLALDKGRDLISAAVLEKRLVSMKEKPAGRAFARRFGATAYAAAPLIAKDKVVGVIVVDNSISCRPLTDDDLRLLQLFTNQAGMAVENSILYNRLEDTNRSLQEAQERLIQEEKLAAIGKMAAGVTHELKNPLVSVGGFAARLKKKLPPASEEWQYADIIVREVQYLEKMLTDILFFSKKTTICYTRCSLNKVIEDSLAVLAAPLEENRIRVEKHLSPGLPSLLGDSHQLRHIFINLFSNAHDVMNEGGVLTIETFPSRVGDKRTVTVRVSDTGGGIPAEVLHNIFNPFFTTKETGTGLGLSIAHRIIANHSGTIEVNNQVGVGAQFTVTLPVRP